MKRLIKWLFYRIKWKNNVKICYGCNISYNASFGGMNQIHSNTSFSGRIGYGSYIGKESIIWADIGKFCSISNRVISNCGIHPYKEPFVSTAPCFYSKNINHSQNGSTFATKQLINEIRSINNEGKYGVKIGNDVWIGEGVFINGGITISDGAMILAHAVITKAVDRTEIRLQEIIEEINQTTKIRERIADDYIVRYNDTPYVKMLKKSNNSKVKFEYAFSW